MKELKNYYNAVEKLTKIFCKKYFKDCYIYDQEDWVGDDIGGIIEINGYFFDMNYIQIALKYKATEDELFGYYDYSLENEVKISFQNYLKYFRGFSFEEINQRIKGGIK